MPKQQAKKIGADALGALGIKIPSTPNDFAAIVLGSDKPRPPQAKRVITEGAEEEGDTTTTFYSPTVDNQPEGWVHCANAIDFEI